MKNKYALFLNNDNSFGPFEVAVRGSLESVGDIEDPGNQFKVLKKNLGREFALVELDGSVVTVKLVLTLVEINMKKLRVEVKEKLEFEEFR